MIFGTSGVRGFINSTLTPTFAYKITQAFVKVYHVDTVTIGRDNRAQSVPVCMAVTSALLSSGVNVVDLGISPTPATIRIMKELKYDSAISVTGSHTPPPITGILFFLSDTGELGPADSELVEKAYRKGYLSEVPWTKMGKYETFYDYQAAYIESIKRDAPKISNSNIVFDAGNGAIGPLAQQVFSDIGLNYKVINKLPLYNFPNRLPSPIPAHLKETISLVPHKSATFGVATDSDGDRAIFIDEHGKLVWGDITGAIFASRMVKSSSSKVITTINTSDSVSEAVKSAGGKLIVTRVGPPAIAASIRKHRDAVFATEESGKFIWPRILMYGDAIYSTLMLLSLKEPLSRLAREVPFFYLIKREVRCQDEIKQKVMEMVSAAFRGYRINRLDGIKVSMGKHRWLLIRPSGTEPVFRVFAQSTQRKDAEIIAGEGVRAIQESKSSI
ncbi:MAG: hypothetical protein JRN01_00365 [Nitrososphaerota archaeon]|nr:hypothetical protein [Nitrososphaerota archaeon]